MSSLMKFPVSLPLNPISSDVDAEAICYSFLPQLTTLTSSSFIASAVWRDLYALTGTLRTFINPATILAAWNETTKLQQPTNFSLQPNTPQIIHAGPANWIQASFNFETEKTICEAIVSLVQEENGEWKVWLLRTILVGLKGDDGISVDFLEVESFIEARKQIEEDNHFDCIVVGAGQSGLSVAGRLKALGLSYVLLDKYHEVGDNWKMRYDSCKLHLPRETAHLPFDRTFGPEYPEYLTKDDLTRGYRDWAEKYDINVWTNTELKEGKWDESKKLWSLKIQRGLNDKMLTSSHVVIAVGAAQIATMPDYPNQEIFKGAVLHSADYKNSSAWKGKHGIIVGTANTAHDVAEDMLNAGLASVTMVQRSPTYVVPAEYLRDVLSHSYNAQIPTRLSDNLSWSIPYPIMARLYEGGVRHRASMEPERYNALENAGFRLDWDGYAAEHIFERLGGHYVDVGASKKISEGLIKIKSNSLPTHYTSDGIAFSDNSILPADVVIFATGFRSNFRHAISKLFSPSIADSMGDFWGINAEGEIQGAFIPGGQKAMYYIGGDQSQCRYFSRFIALSIKADVMGTPLSLYNN